MYQLLRMEGGASTGAWNSQFGGHSVLPWPFSLDYLPLFKNLVGQFSIIHTSSYHRQSCLEAEEQALAP